MHHRITYMHVNFRQNPICRPVKKTMLTNLFAKIACCINLQPPIAFFLKIDYIRHASNVKKNLHVGQQIVY